VRTGHVLRLVQPDGERQVWLLDGEEVASTSHDSDGWDGMHAVGEALLAVARKLGWMIKGVERS
jgi:hypothetical protein